MTPDLRREAPEVIPTADQGWVEGVRAAPAAGLPVSLPKPEAVHPDFLERCGKVISSPLRPRKVSHAFESVSVRRRCVRQHGREGSKPVDDDDVIRQVRVAPVAFADRCLLDDHPARRHDAAARHGELIGCEALRSAVRGLTGRACGSGQCRWPKVNERRSMPVIAADSCQRGHRRWCV